MIINETSGTVTSNPKGNRTQVARNDCYAATTCRQVSELLTIIAFDKERFHNAIEIKIFGPFVNTNLAPLKNFSGANDVISIDYVLLVGIMFHV